MKQSDGDFSIIVGGEDMIGESLYTFHDADGRKFSDGWFKNDNDAIEWLEVHYPQEFQRGVELRCWEHR